MSPKCTSWLGHKYEARYSKTFPNGQFQMEGGSVRALEATKNVTYERDICVRCGHVVELHPR
jgi:hypothetical protein